MTDSQPRLSFEFFPTKTPEGKEKLIKVRDQLNEFEPDFFSHLIKRSSNTCFTPV